MTEMTKLNITDLDMDEQEEMTEQEKAEFREMEEFYDNSLK